MKFYLVFTSLFSNLIDNLSGEAVYLKGSQPQRFVIKKFFFLLLLTAISSNPLFAIPESDAKPVVALNLINQDLSKGILSPFQDSKAYKQYTRRPKSEMSKLLYLVDRLSQSNLEIFHNGKPYHPASISLLVKQYVLMNYKKEKAEDWLSKYARQCNGKVIYLKGSAGDTRTLWEVLIEELKALPQ